jgi:hypothetical protein
MESLMCWRRRRATERDEAKHLVYCQPVDTRVKEVDFDGLKERIEELEAR